MATSSAGEEDVEYESDPEELKRSLSMRRRREASDDEEGEDGGGEEEGKGADRRSIRSDESEDEGGVADYDDEEEGLLEEEVEVEEEEVVEVKVGEDEEEVYEERGVEEGVVNGSVVVVKDSDADFKPNLEESGDMEEGDGEEEKKETEPFSVPTAGAFYMHDDRFRDNAGGRGQRRMRGGRRLWESKDERKWGHDKFEEITFQDRPYKEGRRPSRGNFRGRGKTRGVARGGYVRGDRKSYDDRDNQNQVPKGVVRGRGPRRYEPTYKNNDAAPQMQNRQSGKPVYKASNVSSGRAFTPISNSESDPVPAKKPVLASNLNYASPPFYPSGSANKDTSLTPKRDVQTGSTSRNVHTGVMGEGFVAQQNNALHRGKNIVDSISMDKLHIDGSFRPSVGKPLNNLHMHPPGSSEVRASQSTHPRASGRGGPIPVQMNYHPAASHNQVNKITPSPTQYHAIQKTSAPGRTSMQAPAPQLGHRPGSSSPPKASVANGSDAGEIDVASESGKSMGTLVGNERAVSQGNGRGSFIYGGAMGTPGNMGGGRGDQNFPTFLPVMQFGGQHPGGMGVPAVGMAFPGYVANPQLGMGSSEMTWLPVLAGAAGALGATYGSPYLTVAGAYPGRQSGQTSSAATTSKENNVSKANNEWEPPQRPEPVNDEFGQRQNKPRRYSEMNFGQ